MSIHTLLLHFSDVCSDQIEISKSFRKLKYIQKKEGKKECSIYMIFFRLISTRLKRQKEIEK